MPFEVKFRESQNFNVRFKNREDFDIDLATRTLIGKSLPPGGNVGDILIKQSLIDGDASWTQPAQEVEDDNTIPVTSQAVYAAINDAVETIKQNFSPVYYDTEENWDLQPSLITEEKAIYVYSNHYIIRDNVGNITYVPAIKIGDGTSYLIDMPFLSSSIVLELSNHVNDTLIHVSQDDRIFWNNKVSAFLDKSDSENLVLSKTLFEVEV